MPSSDSLAKRNSQNFSYLSLIEVKGEGDIVKKIAERLGSTKGDVVGPSRRAEIVRVRDIIAYLLREYAEMSYPAVGRLLGNRDHTTIIYAHSKIKDKIEKNPVLGQELFELIDSVKVIKERKARIAHDIIPKILASGKAEILDKRKTRWAVTHREIPERNARILDLYREGLTLQDISSVSGVTRERVRQIVLSTIKQLAVNESISKDIVMDPSVLFEEAQRKHRQAIELKREVLHPKPAPKEKRWSMYYTSCRSCGTTAIPHVRKGLCEQCAGNFRAERREEIIKQNGAECGLCKMPRNEAIAKYGGDLYVTKAKEVLCRSCFRKRTGKNLGDYKKHVWSRYYEQCKSCNTTSVPHMKKGLCENCSDTLTASKREQIIEEHQGKCDICALGRENARAKYQRDLYVTRSGRVVCRGCFKSNVLKRSKKVA